MDRSRAVREETLCYHVPEQTSTSHRGFARAHKLFGTAAIQVCMANFGISGMATRDFTIESRGSLFED